MATLASLATSLIYLCEKTNMVQRVGASVNNQLDGPEVNDGSVLEPLRGSIPNHTGQFHQFLAYNHLLSRFERLHNITSSSKFFLNVLDQKVCGVFPVLTEYTGDDGSSTTTEFSLRNLRDTLDHLSDEEQKQVLLQVSQQCEHTQVLEQLYRMQCIGVNIKYGTSLFNTNIPEEEVSIFHNSMFLLHMHKSRQVQYEVYYQLFDILSMGPHQVMLTKTSEKNNIASTTVSINNMTSDTTKHEPSVKSSPLLESRMVHADHFKNASSSNNNILITSRVNNTHANGKQNLNISQMLKNDYIANNRNANSTANNNIIEDDDDDDDLVSVIHDNNITKPVQNTTSANSAKSLNRDDYVMDISPNVTSHSNNPAPKPVQSDYYKDWATQQPNWAKNRTKKGIPLATLEVALKGLYLEITECITGIHATTSALHAMKSILSTNTKSIKLFGMKSILHASHVLIQHQQQQQTVCSMSGTLLYCNIQHPNITKLFGEVTLSIRHTLESPNTVLEYIDELFTGESSITPSISHIYHNDIILQSNNAQGITYHQKQEERTRLRDLKNLDKELTSQIYTYPLHLHNQYHIYPVDIVRNSITQDNEQVVLPKNQKVPSVLVNIVKVGAEAFFFIFCPKVHANAEQTSPEALVDFTAVARVGGLETYLGCTMVNVGPLVENSHDNANQINKKGTVNLPWHHLQCTDEQLECLYSTTITRTEKVHTFQSLFDHLNVKAITFCDRKKPTDKNPEVQVLAFHLARPLNFTQPQYFTVESTNPLTPTRFRISKAGNRSDDTEIKFTMERKEATEYGEVIKSDNFVVVLDAPLNLYQLEGTSPQPTRPLHQTQSSQTPSLPQELPQSTKQSPGPEEGQDSPETDHNNNSTMPSTTNIMNTDIDTVYNDIIRHNLAITTTTPTYPSILHYVCIENRVELLFELLCHPNISLILNLAPLPSLQTPLHAAAIHGNIEIMQIQLDAGANSDMVDNQNYTILHHQCKQKQIITNVQGIPVTSANTPCKLGFTPFLLAIIYKQGPLVKKMLEQTNVDLSVQTKNGKDYIYYLQYSSEDVKVHIFNYKNSDDLSDSTSYLNNLSSPTSPNSGSAASQAYTHPHTPHKRKH